MKVSVKEIQKNNSQESSNRRRILAGRVEEEEVHSPGLPRQPASEMHLRPKPDGRLAG